MLKILAFNLLKFIALSYLGQNIKKLRQVKGLSQQAFAELFELKRANISSYEEQRAEPKLEYVIKIANYFSIPLNDFIERQLSVNEILKFEDYFEENIQNNETTFSEIPFLNREKIIGNQSFYNQLNSLPKINFPIYNKSQLLAIEMNSSIPHHHLIEKPDGAILFFEAVDLNNLHLINQSTGLFWNENDLFLGKFKTENSKIFLELNEWKVIELNMNEPNNFWVLYGIYAKHNA